MKLTSVWKWMRRLAASMVFLAATGTLLLGLTLYRTERAVGKVNSLILRGDFASTEKLLAKEENFFLIRIKERFAWLRDGRIKLARCRILYGLGRYEPAADSCLAASREVKTDDEKFLAHYYTALVMFSRGTAVGSAGGAATDAIHYLKEALKVKEDGEAQALLAALLEEESAFKKMMKGLKDRGQPLKEKPRMPSLFRDNGGNGAGPKKKGY